MAIEQIERLPDVSFIDDDINLDGIQKQMLQDYQDKYIVQAPRFFECARHHLSCFAFVIAAHSFVINIRIDSPEEVIKSIVCVVFCEFLWNL